MNATIINADCLTALREMPDDSVDAVVTDPPYGLSNTTPAQVAETITRWVSGDREYLPTGRGFMGHEWDAFVPPVAVWDECLRVLKPGGHLLAFAGSRTHDLMTLGIRLAGFEIRDSVAWLYGSGFPKSMDVSKAIDKVRDWSLIGRLSEEIKRARSESGMSLAEIGRATLAATDGTYGKWYHRGGHMFFETGRSLPSRPEWEQLRRVLPIADEFAMVYDEAERQVTGWHEQGNPIGVYEFKHGGGKGRTANERRDIPATDAAHQWEGWGTALKPAFEPVTLARKPLTGTVAANVLEHGTGALNIDACRVSLNGEVAPTGSGISVRATSTVTPYNTGEGKNVTPPAGRWPANVVLDESQAAELDRQASASRFFYVAKAPRAERPVVDGVAHPTVKPVTLMRWLVRMVTPPGGVVLDPFAGSGTTLEAAVLEGFESIGIEREADYLPLIHARIERATHQRASRPNTLFDFGESA